MKKIAIYLMLGVCNLMYSQVVKNYDKVFGATGIDKPTNVFHINGKTYVFGNVTKPSASIGNITLAHGMMDYNMVMYDNTGGKIKDLCFGGDRNDSLIKVFLIDSTFVLMGVSKSANGTGNKDADSSYLDNSTICPIVSEPNGGYSEIYSVVLDFNGNIKSQYSLSPTKKQYFDTNPLDLHGIYEVTKTNPSLYNPLLGAYGFNYVIDVVGIEFDGNWFRIATREIKKVTGGENLYKNMRSGHSCYHAWYEMDTVYTTDVIVWTHVGEYSISKDFTNVFLDKSTEFGNQTFSTHLQWLVSCTSGCSGSWSTEYNYSNGSFRTSTGLVSPSFVNYDPKWFIGETMLDYDNKLFYKACYLPNIYNAKYISGQWLYFIKKQAEDYDFISGSLYSWPGVYKYSIGNYLFGSPNYFLSKPIDVKITSGKMNIIIEDNPNSLPVMNYSTITPKGLTGALAVTYTRSIVSAPTTIYPNKKDIWIVECNFAASTYTDTYMKFNEPFTILSPIKQGSIRANNDIVFNSSSNVFDTNKVFLALSTAATNQYDKRNGNKGGLDYWPVKFNLNTMKPIWDTTIGGLGNDVLSDININDGIMVLTGNSKSGIGVDKSQTAYDLTLGDYWTLNYCFPPSANFISDYQIINSGALVKFNNLSLRASTFSWSFGDGTVSYDKNPVHYFYTPGYYSINLNVSNGNCTSNFSRPNYIYVNDYVGIEEFYNSDNVLYPNPSNNGLFYFKNNADLKIMDVKNVLSQKVNYTIEGEQLKVNDVPGVYFVELEIKNKIQIKKVIIN